MRLQQCLRWHQRHRITIMALHPIRLSWQPSKHQVSLYTKHLIPTTGLIPMIVRLLSAHGRNASRRRTCHGTTALSCCISETWMLLWLLLWRLQLLSRTVSGFHGYLNYVRVNFIVADRFVFDAPAYLHVDLLLCVYVAAVVVMKRMNVADECQWHMYMFDHCSHLPFSFFFFIIPSMQYIVSQHTYTRYTTTLPRQTVPLLKHCKMLHV